MSEEVLEKPLISFTRDRSLTESENHDRFIDSVKDDISLITVEPMMVFFVIIMYLQSYTMGQYIYFRIQTDYNLVPNSTLAFVCKSDANHTDQNVTDKIQSLNAEYGMYIQLSSCIFTILTAPFYCVFSDRFGRKVMFIIPSVGVFIKSLVEVFIQVYHWPIYVFVFTEGFYGLFGGFSFVTGLSYSYVADISKQGMRTKRMAIVGIIMAIGALLTSLATGFWIQYGGYLSPYIFTVVVAALCIIYSSCILKEPPKMPESKGDKFSMMEQMKRLFTVYFHRPRKQTVLLLIIVVMFNFYYVAEMSNLGLSNTYLMSYPICMNSEEMSIIGFLNMLVINVGVGIAVLILVRFFSDLPLVVICLFSGMAFSLQMAFATTKLQVFIAAVSNLFSFSAFPFIRGYLSKRVGPHEQGALFGGLVLSETVCSSITKVLNIYVYGATFKMFHGFIYLVITGFSVVAVVLTSIAIPLDKKIDLFGFSINKDTF